MAPDRATALRRMRAVAETLTDKHRPSKDSSDGGDKLDVSASVHVDQRNPLESNDGQRSPPRSDSPDPNGKDKIRRDSLRARLQDVVKIIIRQNIIKKLTTKLSHHVPQDGLQLCPSCSSLSLEPEDFVLGSKRANKFYAFAGRRHGNFLAIYVKAHRCPLCRLIMEAIAEQPPAKLNHVIVHGQDQTSEGALMRAFCTITWEVDGRVGTQHKTRRLKVSWSDPCYEPIYLFMVADPPNLKQRSSTLRPTFLGRDFRHVNKTKIQLIGEWLQDCCEHHGEECTPAKGENFEDLRESPTFGVIDVVDMSFTKLPKDAEYVALSYQWGPPDDRFTTTCKTVMNIRERKGLLQYVEQLPITIREVIDLVRDLHLRYLWVDSLCIVQDSQDAWDRNASVMDLVYGNAILTIAAADGEDASAGLWAISQPWRRDKQCIEKCTSQLSLMAKYPCETYIRQSKWNTRAWTFQERLLSKRCLIFTKGRLYFQCRKTTMSEDVHTDSAEVGSSLDLEQSHVLDFKDFANDPLTIYKRNVELYTVRFLTKSEDVLSAFFGVSRLLCGRLGGEPVFGLPNSHFDWALLWDPEDAPKRREPGNNMRFPSWSWCGWDKRRMMYNQYVVTDCMVHLNDWLMTHTWITWYIRDSKGDLRLVWDPLRTYPQGKAPLSKTMRGYENPYGIDDPRYDYYGREIPEGNIGLPRNEFQRTIPDFPVQVRTRVPGEKHINTPFVSPDRGILQFWTWSAYFYLHPVDSHPQHKKNKSLQGRIFSRRFSIVDAHHTWAGTIVLDKKWKFDPRRPQHFIAISDALRFWPEEGMIHNNYSMTNKKWPLYNVLLLGYDETSQQDYPEKNDGGLSPGFEPANSTAYRVGLGKIYQDAFDQACETANQRAPKEWREIVLG